MIDFSQKEELQKRFELEKVFLTSMLDIQKNLNKQILIFTKSCASNLSLDGSNNNELVDNINDIMIILNQSNANIEAVKKLIDTIPDVSDCLEKKLSLEEKTNEYYKVYNDTLPNIYGVTKKIQEFIYKNQLSSIKDFSPDEIKSKLNESDEELQKPAEDITISKQELNSSFTEKTLVISETQGKIILPYTLNELTRIMYSENNTYKSLQEVIDQKYTLPITNYKPSSISRFKEAYKLMTEKEHSSKFKAVSLATELLMNYNVHPAIITACKSIDELDIYLACLEDNKLKDFRFFDIKYEIPPMLLKA